MKRIGIVTGGGDAPGINAALKAVVYRADEAGLEAIGVLDGWEGLLGEEVPPHRALDRAMVRTWDRDGGSHLGCSRVNPFRVDRDGRKIDAHTEVLRHLGTLGIDALVVIGAAETLGVALRLSEAGVPVVVIPKSISKEIACTDYALGFDTSMRTCADIIERSRTPAGSRRWVEVVEVFGQRSGHLALWSGLAGGAQVILIPEHRFQLERVYALLDERFRGAGPPGQRVPRYATVVVAEGAAPEGGHAITVDSATDEYGRARLGGIGALLAERIRTDTDIDARAVALGHPQRGGAPSSIDRIMGHMLGSAAMEAVVAQRFGTMVSVRGGVPSFELSLVAMGTAMATGYEIDVARSYDTQRYHALRQVLAGS